MYRRSVVCDACSTEEDVEKLSHPWFTAQTVIGTHEQYERMLEEVHGEEGKLQADAGQFCSLGCLANWASTTQNLHALDKEVGE
jgi:hypothetical protein